DLVRVTKNSGMAMFGIGLSTAPVGQRINEAAEQAMNSPFLDVDISISKGVLLSIQGGKDLMLEEAATALDLVKKRVGEKTEIIMGTSLDYSMNGKVQILILATGVKTKYDVRPGPGKGYGEDIDSVS
ncbi:cell division protein, partial [mine drainage metagenome]